jgi:hypothetical protein
MHKLMEGSVRIGLRLFNGSLVLIGRGFQWPLAERLRLGGALREVLFEQKLIGPRILDENRSGIKSRRILYVVCQAGIARSRFRGHTTTKGVKKIIGVNAITVGPARILSQVEDEFRRVVVYTPALGDGRHGRHRLGMVFNQAFVYSHENASLRLSSGPLRIERFRLIA